MQRKGKEILSSEASDPVSATIVFVSVPPSPSLSPPNSSCSRPPSSLAPPYPSPSSSTTPSRPFSFSSSPLLSLAPYDKQMIDLEEAAYARRMSGAMAGPIGGVGGYTSADGRSPMHLRSTGVSLTGAKGIGLYGAGVNGGGDGSPFGFGNNTGLLQGVRGATLMTGKPCFAMEDGDSFWDMSLLDHHHYNLLHDRDRDLLAMATRSSSRSSNGVGGTTRRSGRDCDIYVSCSSELGGGDGSFAGEVPDLGPLYDALTDSAPCSPQSQDILDEVERSMRGGGGGGDVGVGIPTSEEEETTVGPYPGSFFSLMARRTQEGVGGGQQQPRLSPNRSVGGLSLSSLPSSRQSSGMQSSSRQSSRDSDEDDDDDDDEEEEELEKKKGRAKSTKPLDRYGFLKSSCEASVTDFKKPKTTLDREREERRLRKWRKMIGAGGAEWKQYEKKKPLIVKRRIRKGIPDCLRGLVWQLISGSRDLLLANQGHYEQLVFYESSPAECDIIRDISRTFPSHVFFQQRHGPGQRSLYNVLKAYSLYDRDVGYVQGMGFLAGLLLLYMGEEDAFWLMVALLKGARHAPMEGLYLVGLPLVQQYLYQFEQLVKEQIPKLGDHFEKEMVNASMYASQWFITVFSYSFPFALALRIWDVFLHEGMKIVFRIGLALLKYCQESLIKLPFEKLIYGLRNFPEDALDPDTLLPLAYNIKVSKRLDELRDEYIKLHNPQAMTRVLKLPTAPQTAANKRDSRRSAEDRQIR